MPDQTDPRAGTDNGTRPVPVSSPATGAPDNPGDPPPPDGTSQRAILRTAWWLYGGFVVAALVIRGLHRDNWTWHADLGLPPLLPMAAGLGVAGAVLLLTPWMERFEWVQRLTRLLREQIGPLTIGQALLLGLLSGIGEELLFRGALQPWLGPVAATLLFAVLHALGWWWLFALVVGAAFAAIYEWSGNLWPCIAAHVLINTVNLYRGTRPDPPANA